MSADIEDDAGGEIPWPGFVDILSAVIMVFIFFVMVTVVIITQLDKKKEEFNSVSETEIDITEVEELSQKQIIALIKEKQELQKKLEEIYFTQDNNSKSVTQKVTRTSPDSVMISYGDFGVTLIDKIEAEIENLSYKGKKISLISYAPQNLGFTTVQEIALNRSFSIRNFYLGKGVSPKDIKLKINRNIDEAAQKCKNDTVENDVTFGCVYIQIIE